MERWDAYDRNFRKVEGVTLIRGEPILLEHSWL